MTGVISGPLSGATMKYLHQLGGLEGWQWVYLTQASRPSYWAWWSGRCSRTARRRGWLNEQECLRLAENLRQCRSTEHKLTVREELMQVVRMPAIWLLAMATFLELGAVHAWGFWLPTLIRNPGVTNLVSIGAIASVASVVGAGAIVAGDARPLHEPALVFLALTFTAPRAR